MSDFNSVRQFRCYDLRSAAIQEGHLSAHDTKKSPDRRRVQIDDETLAALDLLGKERSMTFEDLLREAVRDLLKKYGRQSMDRSVG